jgi:thimet oligopeptidase
MIDYRTTTPADIERAQEETIRAADRIVAAMVAVPEGERTFANTLAPLEEVSDLLEQTFGRYGFMAYVAVEAEVRNAAEHLREALDKYGIDLSFREDVHAGVTAFAHTDEAAALTGERQRLLERTLRDYRRNGFDLPPEQRERVRALKARLVEIGIAFRRNIDAYDDAIWVTREELAGLPDSYVERLKTDSRHDTTIYRVSLDYPEFFPFMDNAESEDLRRELYLKSYRKGGPENVALLEEAIAIRDELARLLGYPSWDAYVLEIRMAQTPEQAHRFLADLRERIRPRLERDLEDLTDAKRAHTGRKDARLEAWDWRFYHTYRRRTRYAVDEFEVAQYFPLDAVLAGLFDVTQTLLGVRFEEVEPANAWHPDVKLFRVLDVRGDWGSRERSPRSEGGPRGAEGRDLRTNAEPRGFPNPEGNQEVAYFYMDLFPRENKYGHAAAFTLRGGRRLPDGSYQRPVSAIVANFTKPTATQPSLLRHSEVETLFHEFGHILHQTLTAAEYLRFSGSRTERDFVEAPSQMLEQWVWLPEVLERFSRHVETGEPLPRTLLEAMIAAKHLHAGVLIARQLFFAELDLAYHGPGARKDTTAIARELHPISGFAMPEGTYWQAGFGHLFGYDAGYYGYLWSEVFAYDMFSRFETEGPLNEALGLEYRQKVLEPGGSRDGIELLREFLGREPASDAYLRHLGL